MSLAFASSFLFPLVICTAASERMTLWQNLINHGTAQAKSPCRLAQIQEETVMVVNQHANGVNRGQVEDLAVLSSLLIKPGLPLTTGLCPCNAALVVKKLKSATNCFPALLIIPPSFLSTGASCGAALPSLFFSGATSICLCRCVLFLVCHSLITVVNSFLPSFSSLSLWFRLAEMFVDGVFFFCCCC